MHMQHSFELGKSDVMLEASAPPSRTNGMDVISSSAAELGLSERVQELEAEMTKVLMSGYSAHLPASKHLVCSHCKCFACRVEIHHMLLLFVQVQSILLLHQEGLTKVNSHLGLNVDEHPPQ